MKGSVKLVRVFGINVSVHWTFLLLIAYIVFVAARAGADGPGIAMSVLFVLAIFVCVVLHELGHALTARVFGVQTRGITLLPIGGVAALERIPTVPSQELLIAIAGPAVNVVIAGIAYPAARLLGDIPMSAGVLSPQASGFLMQLAIVNIWLVLFNLLPAFPMDGGRVLRALLAMWIDYAKATAVAAAVGQVLAMGFVAWGLFAGSPFLILIAVFVYLGGQAEAFAAQTRSALMGTTVAEAMQTDFRVLGEGASLADAAELLLAGAQQDFPVVDAGGRPVGMLSRRRLLEGVARLGMDHAVAEAVDRDGPVLHERDPLPEAAEVLRTREPAVPVVRDGRVIGLLTQENLSEFLMLREARGR